MPPKRKRDSGKAAFRFNSTTLYATFPQCDTPMQTVVNNMKEKWETRLEYWIVCSEKHEDGNLHLHVLIKFRCKLDVSSPHFADFLSKNQQGKTFHGNYLPAKGGPAGIAKIINYIKKDGNFIDSGNLPEEKVKISTTIACAIRDGKSLREIDKLDPGYTMNNLKKIREYQSLIQEFKNEDEDLAKLRIPIPLEIEAQGDPDMQRLMDWCEQNFYKRDRPIREPQLWLKTPIRCGKTTWLACLQKFMRVYIVGYERESFDEYRDEKYDIIVFDEYKNQKKLEFLNSLIDGQDKRLMQLYSGQNTTKKVNLPVIFLSNYHPVEAYPSASNVTRDAFIDRLCIVELSQSNLFPFIDYLNGLVDAANRVTVAADAS